MIKIIKEFTDKNNLLSAVLDASPMDYLLPLLQKHDLSCFVTPNIYARFDPRQTMPDAKSIIVIGMPYENAASNDNHNDTANDAADTGSLCGSISWAACGLDYHIKLNRILSSLTDELLSVTPFEYRIYADTGPLNERALAYRGGLGFLGKNQFVISPEYGSNFFIGYILLNLSIEPMTRAVSASCGSCLRCITACLGQALSPDGFNYMRCVAYLTQAKHVLSGQEMESMGISLYGCDICQNICPHNRWRGYPQMVALKTILAMSNKEFKQCYGKTAAGWRGKSVFVRNAIIAATNSGNAAADSIIQDGMNDERYWIRSAAHWAKNKRN